MKTVYEKNYDLMIHLGIIPESNDFPLYRKSISPGYMDLIVERNKFCDEYNNGQKCIGFSIAHYFVQNGTLCSSPLMEILYHPELKMVEAYTFEMSEPPIYWEVYPQLGKVNLQEKKSQNEFLSEWLNNLVMQKHGKRWEDHSTTILMI
jgi:hypothetical protein